MKILKPFLATVFTILLVFGVWEIVCLKHTGSALPTPHQVIQDLMVSTERYYWKPFIVTIKAASGGVFVSSIIALLMGSIQTILPTLGHPCRLIMVACKAIPAVAFVPVLMIFLPPDYSLRILTAAFISVCPIYLGVIHGIESAPAGLLKFCSQLGAPPLKLFLSVQKNYAMQGLFRGLETGAPLAIIGAIVAEILGGGRPTGLGSGLLRGPAEDAVGVFSQSIILSVAGIISYMIAILLHRTWTKYRHLDESST
jgi:NitT/TauT family transport system permease protein